MDLGVTTFVTDQTIDPARLASEVEQRGLESLFLPEHTHIPTSRLTPYPMGGELPEEYKRTLDPFVALAAAASATSRLRLGTGVCLVAQRDPIVLAKEVATLDHLSGGRFVFGIGYGWNRDELEDHGVAFAERREVVRQRVLAMKALWAREPTGFSGEHARVSPSWAWPKPAQEPHPPIVVGGAAGPSLFRHVCEFADGWSPIGGSGLRAALAELARRAEEAGRDPASIEVSVTWAQPELGRLEHYASLGVRRVVLGLPPGGPDQVLPVLDGFARLAEALAG
ncbi:MAG TPA: TIGR03619 family F420-dependent LLM class oxidoreductase [Acidimicrobiales bacterium]|jgi:probable F420-dependent oxidoreductase|nr:TIGR03619 family F420-dependent LLM class oxidoreductase [Acidimicrobiales bacterium]